MTLRRIGSIAAIAGALAALAPTAALAQAGTLDASFSADGKAFHNVTSGADYAVDVAVQTDGRVVAVGTAWGMGGRIALLRYDVDGTLDPSFGGDGKVFTNLTPGYDWVAAVQVQADGKIVVAGRAGGQGGRVAVLRYTPNGGLDPTFSGDGKVVTNFSSGDDFAFGVALQTDGAIVVAGRAAGAGGRMLLARYTNGGAPDASFSGDGRVLINWTPRDDRLDDVVIAADGKIVAGGTFDYFSRRARFAVVRLNGDGSPDTTFSADGRVTTNFTGWFDGVFGVAVDAGGKIVAAGQANLGIGVARYADDGTLDPTFSGDGKATTNLTPEVDYAEELEIQTDGKIVVAGGASYSGLNARFALVRYEPSGALDTTFSADGKVVTDMTPGFDAAYGLALAPDGKIVTAGYAARQGGRFAVARYLGG